MLAEREDSHNSRSNQKDLLNIDIREPKPKCGRLAFDGFVDCSILRHGYCRTVRNQSVMRTEGLRGLAHELPLKEL